MATTKDIQELFEKCKKKIEEDFQKELDRVAGEEEPEEILAAYDPDYAYELERDNNL